MYIYIYILREQRRYVYKTPRRYSIHTMSSAISFTSAYRCVYIYIYIFVAMLNHRTHLYHSLWRIYMSMMAHLCPSGSGSDEQYDPTSKRGSLAVYILIHPGKSVVGLWIDLKSPQIRMNTNEQEPICWSNWK